MRNKYSALLVAWLAVLLLLDLSGIASVFTKIGNPSSNNPPSIEQNGAIGKFLYFQNQHQDVERYLAYANATLGRPFASSFVVLTDDAPEVRPSGADGAVVAERPLRPWRDFRVEYPPAMLIAALLPAAVTSDLDRYGLLFSVEMEVFLTLAVVLAVRSAEALTPGSGGRALVCSLLLTLALGGIAVRRYDACVALAISGCFYALISNRPMLSGAALALGVAFKGVPLLVAPVIVIWYFQRRDWRGLWRSGIGGGLVLGLFTAAYFAIAGAHGFDAFAYHFERPIQLESTYGGALMMLKALAPDVASVEFGFGSWNVVSKADPIIRAFSDLALVVALIAAYRWAYRRISRAGDDRTRLLSVIYACAACLVAFITLGKVFSGQYLIWLIPLGAIAGAHDRGEKNLRLGIANVFAQVIYPYLYHSSFMFGPLAPILGLMVLARSFVLWRWVAHLSDGPGDRFRP